MSRNKRKLLMTSSGDWQGCVLDGGWSSWLRCYCETSLWLFQKCHNRVTGLVRFKKTGFSPCPCVLLMLDHQSNTSITVSSFLLTCRLTCEIAGQSQPFPQPPTCCVDSTSTSSELVNNTVTSAITCSHQVLIAFADCREQRQWLSCCESPQLTCTLLLLSGPGGKISSLSPTHESADRQNSRA